MANEILAVPRPFTGGLVDDPTRPDQMSEGRDVIFPRGVACERGGYGPYAANLPLGSSFPLTGIVQAPILGITNSALTVVTNSNGAIGTADSPQDGVHAQGTLGVRYLPGPVWGGEVLLLPQDGVSPILRYAGARQAVSAKAGTITWNAGSTTITGSGTNFTASAVVGMYFRAQNIDARIVAIRSATEMTVATRNPSATLTTGVWSLSHVGRLGLKTLVTDMGRANAAANTSGVAGTGTLWTSRSKGHGAVKVGDLLFGFGQESTTAPTGSTGAWDIATVTSANELVTAQPIAPGLFNDRYNIARFAVGRLAAGYRNRLYLAGVDWNDDRVYISPPGYDLGAIWNEIDSLEVHPGAAQQFKFVEVPGPDAAGRIEALLSTPSGLLILRSESTHVLTGEYPANRVDKIADVGCFGPTAALNVDDVTVFAGVEGVFLVAGGRFTNITEGLRDRTWRTLQPMSRCVLGIIRNHLLVSVSSFSGQARTLVYDLARQRWCGDMTLPTNVAFMHSARNPGVTDDLLAVGPAWTGAVSLKSVIVDHEETMPVTTNPGAFFARTPVDFAGSRTRLRRLLEVKVAVDLEATGGDENSPTAAGLAVTAQTDDVSSVEERRITNGYSVTRVRGATQALGMRTHKGSLAFARVGEGGTEVYRLAIHALDLVMRKVRERA